MKPFYANFAPTKALRLYNNTCHICFRCHLCTHSPAAKHAFALCASRSPFVSFIFYFSNKQELNEKQTLFIVFISWEGERRFITSQLCSWIYIVAANTKRVCVFNVMCGNIISCCHMVYTQMVLCVCVCVYVCVCKRVSVWVVQLWEVGHCGKVTAEREDVGREHSVPGWATQIKAVTFNQRCKAIYTNTHTRTIHTMYARALPAALYFNIHQTCLLWDNIFLKQRLHKSNCGGGGGGGGVKHIHLRLLWVTGQ